MDDIWFGSVLRIFEVSYELCGAEELEGERVEELSDTENAGGWLDSKASLAL